MDGVKLLLLKEGSVLAVDCGKDGWCLPSAQVLEGEDPEAVAKVLLAAITGKKKGEVTHLAEGPDDEFARATTYSSDFSGKPKYKKASWVSPDEVLKGKWGLHALETFKKVGLVTETKARMRVDELYRASARALSRETEDASTKAVDMVLDEVELLMGMGKPWALDRLLQELDVTRLHADVLAAFQAVIERIPELPAKESFNLAASRRIAQIDGIRTPIRFGSISDVRAEALKGARKRGEEFSKALRDGTLSKRFPWMKHIAEAEARVKDGRAPSGGFSADWKIPPVSEWPEAYRAEVPERQDVVPEVDPYKPDARGISLQRPGPRHTISFETTEEGKFRVERIGDEVTRTKVPDEESPFAKELRAALDGARESRKTEITIDIETAEQLKAFLEAKDY